MTRIVTIGKAEGCDIRITNDEYMSGRHARIVQDETGTWIADLGSTNGTHVRRGGGPWQKVIGPTPIRPGVTILVGRTQIPWTST